MTDFKAQMLSSVKSRERSIMKNVYLWMTAGLSLTGVVSYLVASSPSLPACVPRKRHKLASAYRRAVWFSYIPHRPHTENVCNICHCGIRWVRHAHWNNAIGYFHGL